MPSTSWKQHKFFTAVEHSPAFAKKVGVPQSVGADFAKADNKAGITKQPDVPRRVKRKARRAINKEMTHDDFEALGRD
jgi:hypothetical protein